MLPFHAVPCHRVQRPANHPTYRIQVERALEGGRAKWGTTVRRAQAIRLAEADLQDAGAQGT